MDCVCFRSKGFLAYLMAYQPERKRGFTQHALWQNVSFPVFMGNVVFQLFTLCIYIFLIILFFFSTYELLLLFRLIKSNYAFIMYGQKYLLDSTRMRCAQTANVAAEWIHRLFIVLLQTVSGFVHLDKFILCVDIVIKKFFRSSTFISVFISRSTRR